MDPLRVEQHFQEIRHVLAGPASARFRLVALDRFLQTIDADDPFIASYLVELFADVPALVHALDPAGLDPEQCRRLMQRLRRALALHDELQALDGFAVALDRLRERIVLLYAFVGDLDAAARVALSGSAEEEPLPGVEGVGLPPLERLDRTVRRAWATDRASTAVFERLSVMWHEELEASQGAAVLPVVEQALLDGEDGERLAGLRRVRVELYGRRAEADHLAFDVAVSGAESPEKLLEASVRAARALLAVTHPSLAGRHVAGLVRFDEAVMLHEGRSSDLAIAALFYCAMVQQGGQRRRYVVVPGAAMTGRIGPGGRVQAVDEQSLEAKVRAVFFSWVTCLAVPKEQLGTAEAVRDGLRQQYPHRQLDLVGVEYLREVFFDRRLTAYREDGVVRHALRRAWRRKYSVGGVAVIAVLLLVIGRLLYGPIDRNPVAADLSGEVLVLTNAAGQSLARLSLGSMGTRHYTRVDTYTPGTTFPVTYVDVDADGINEVIWAVPGNEGVTDYTRALQCLDLEENQACWETPVAYTLDFPERRDVAESTYTVDGLSAGDFDGDGRPELIAVINHGHYFPGLVARFNAQTGEEEGHYVNAGRLYGMATVDLNDDATPEIVVGGNNVAYGGEAVVVVLDPRRLHGHGPARGIYRMSGDPKAREIAYIRIPRTELGRVQHLARPESMIRYITLNSQARQVIARMFDVVVRDSTGGPNSLAGFLLHFNYDLTPADVGVDSKYRLLARQYFADSLVQSLPNQEYLDDYVDGYRYWNGEGWQEEPYVDWEGISAGGERRAASDGEEIDAGTPE